MSKRRNLEIRRKAKAAVDERKGFVARQYFNFMCAMPLRRRIVFALMILFRQKLEISAKA